jgi:diguanylate cyclase (GGDEF)-like protein
MGDAAVRARTFQVLYELAVTSSGVLDPNAIARLAADGARELLRVDTAALFWWDAEAQRLVRLADNDPQAASKAPLHPPEGGVTLHAVELQTAVLVDDYASSEWAAPRMVARGMRSLASVPLMVNDRAVGALTVRSLQRRKWTSEDAQLLHLLAAQVAPSLEAARLHAESERRRAEAEALAELVRVGATEHNLDRTIAFIGEQAGKLIGADYDGIALIEDDGSSGWRGMWGNRTQEWGVHTRGLGTGTLQKVVRERRTLTFLNVGDSPGATSQTHWREGGRTVLSTPLMVRDQVVGALTLGWRSPVTPTAGQTHLAEAVASYAATVLDSARAYNQQQAARARAEDTAASLSRREQALRALHEVAVAAGGVLDPAALARLVIDHSRAMTGFDAAGLYWAESPGQDLLPLADNAPSESNRPASIKAGTGAAGTAYETGKPVVVEDYRSWSRQVARYAVRVKTIIALPLRIEQHTMGVLVVRSYSRRQVSAEDLNLLELLAAQVAPAIEAARLHAHSEQQRAEAEALAELARQGAVEHDGEHLIRLICEQATKLSGADYAGVRLLEEDGALRWRGMAGNRSDRWRLRARSRGRGSATAAMQLGKTIVSRPADVNPAAAADPTTVRNVEGGLVELATPLVYRGEPRGALLLAWRTEIDPGPDQIRVAEVLAGYATVILENARAHLALAQQALYDELTELPNRRLFQDRLEQAILTSCRDGHPIALLLMDLDRFKDVNDTMGHLAGDALLRELGKRLRSSLRSSDTVARLGGDEFAVILTTLGDHAGATVAAQKILDVVGEPLQLRGQPLQVTGSIGIALYPEHGSDPETLLRRADVAMYVAKRAGSGSATYAPEMDRDRADHLALVHDLRRGVEENELVLEFQPRVDLSTHAVVGAEALVRWHHPQHGLIPPVQFIPVAEQMGLIRQLSRWVLEAAYVQRSAWRAAGLDLNIAVNLSMRDLHDRQLPGVLAELGRKYDLGGSWLTIEITEGAVMSDPAAARLAVATLRKAGVRISLDDFGTGYSSLGYLSQLSVDEIKIDRSFVHRVTRDPKNLALVRATIDMGHALGASVIAEGVENAATLELLDRLGCDGAQGFHICKPLSVPALERWLRRGPTGPEYSERTGPRSSASPESAPARASSR